MTRRATPEEITVTDGAIQVVVKAVTQDITVYYYDEEAGESAEMQLPSW